jgi:hypothetical protein
MKTNRPCNNKRNAEEEKTDKRGKETGQNVNFLKATNQGTNSMEQSLS